MLFGERTEMVRIPESLTSQIAQDALSLGEDRVVLQVLQFTACQLSEVDIYRHENGFVKVTLGAFFNRQIRVHLWDQEHDWSVSNIHSHRHPILSRIVTGSFEESRWLCDASGISLKCYAFRPAAPGQLELAERGSISLRSDAVRVRRAGHLYSIPVNEFHTVRPLLLPTITIFTQDLSTYTEGMVASDRPLTAVRRPQLMNAKARKSVYEILSEQISLIRLNLEHNNKQRSDDINRHGK
jgi:hypothetical protein